MSNFATRMAAYDQQLQELDAKISPYLKELLTILKPMQKVDVRRRPQRILPTRNYSRRYDGPPIVRAPLDNRNA